MLADDIELCTEDLKKIDRTSLEIEKIMAKSLHKDESDTDEVYVHGNER